MIKEDYVSFETAKLLKKRGFPQEYDMFHSLIYNEEDYVDEYEVERMVTQTKVVKAGTLSSYPAGVPEPKCYCPTLQMARKWLREDKNVDIEISVYSKGFDGTLTYCADILTYGSRLIMEQPIINSTYEQTCEKAIQYALKNVLTFENVKMEIHDVAGKDSTMPKVILNDFIRKKKKNTMTSYRTNEEIIKEFCEENLTTYKDHWGDWVETKHPCKSVDEFVKLLMQHIKDNHGKC